MLDELDVAHMRQFLEDNSLNVTAPDKFEAALACDQPWKSLALIVEVQRMLANDDQGVW